MAVLLEQGQHHRVWIDPLKPKERKMAASLTEIAFESVEGSGNFDQTHDLSGSAVNNAQLNGFLCNTSKFHYAIQTQPAAQQQQEQGTVGFGGRGGSNWFRFRLERVGYIHAPTRQVTPIKKPNGDPVDPADYSGGFSATTHQTQFGEDILNLSSVGEWRNLWTTPGGGECYLQWRWTPRGLKEEVVINQVAREWIATNSPPQTPPAQTYFGFRFVVDFSNIPKIVNNGVEKTADQDFDDANAGTELKTLADELLAFLPINFAYVKNRGGRVRLIKRFYQDNGVNYLFVGAKVSDLNSTLLPGDIIFDPSINPSIAAANDDCFTNSGSFYNHYNYYCFTGIYSGAADDAGLRWSGFTTIPAGATITTSNIQVYPRNKSGSPTCEIYADLGSSAAWSTSDRPNLSNITETTAHVTWNTFTTGSYNTSPSLNSVVQEVIDTNGATSGLRFGLIGGGSGTNEVGFEAYEYFANPAILNVTWTEGSTYTLTASAGSFALTGTSAGLNISRLLTASAGSFALTGSSVGVNAQRDLQATAGSFALTGSSAGMIASRLLNATAGSFALTGANVSLDLTYSLVASAGSYALSGTDAALLASRVLTASSGSFSLTGTSIALDISRLLTANSGSYSLSGTDASLQFSKLLTANAGSFSLSGSNVDLLASRLLSASAGSFSLNGTNVDLTFQGNNYTLTANSGSFSLNGTNADLNISRLLSATAASFAVNGTNVSLDLTRYISASAGAFVLTGNSIGLLADRILNATTGSFIFSGTTITLTFQGANALPPILENISFVSNTVLFGFGSNTETHFHDSNTTKFGLLH